MPLFDSPPSAVRVRACSLASWIAAIVPAARSANSTCCRHRASSCGGTSCARAAFFAAPSALSLPSCQIGGYPASRASSAERWLRIQAHLAEGCRASALASSTQHGRLTPSTTVKARRRMRSHIFLTARQSVTMRPPSSSTSTALAVAIASPAATLSPGTNHPETVTQLPPTRQQMAQPTIRTCGSLGCMPDAST